MCFPLQSLEIWHELSLQVWNRSQMGRMNRSTWVWLVPRSRPPTRHQPTWPRQQEPQVREFVSKQDILFHSLCSKIPIFVMFEEDKTWWTQCSLQHHECHHIQHDSPCPDHRGIQDFGQRGQRSFDSKGGALSPKFAQNWGFPVKLPENCLGLPWIYWCWHWTEPGREWFQLLLCGSTFNQLRSYLLGPSSVVPSVLHCFCFVVQSLQL